MFSTARITDHGTAHSVLIRVQRSQGTPVAHRTTAKPEHHCNNSATSLTVVIPVYDSRYDSRVIGTFLFSMIWVAS